MKQPADAILQTPEPDGHDPLGAGFPPGAWGRALFWLAVLFSTFQIALAAHLIDMPSQIARAVHVGFLMALGFPLLAYAKHMGGIARTLTLILAGMGIAVTAYQWIEYNDLLLRAGEPLPRDIWFGVAALITVFAAAWMLMGPALPIISGLFLAYALLGQHLPSPFNHRGYDFAQVVEHITYGTEGRCCRTRR